MGLGLERRKSAPSGSAPTTVGPELVLGRKMPPSTRSRAFDANAHESLDAAARPWMTSPSSAVVSSSPPCWSCTTLAPPRRAEATVWATRRILPGSRRIKGLEVSLRSSRWKESPFLQSSRFAGSDGGAAPCPLNCSSHCPVLIVEVGAWKPLGISDRKRVRLRKEVLLAGEDWTYDPSCGEMCTKRKGHKVDRITVEK
ncbi:hypothetical protein ZWY2020_052942 [Hordeum vulgare]|nr:hypothetical protein ZWY2020_052942 [Hordeum vulgare]